MKQPNRTQKPLKARNAALRATRERKRKEAEARQAAYQALTPQQRLDRLDKAFGKGQGARRERARILKALTAPAQGVSGTTLKEAQTKRR